MQLKTFFISLLFFFGANSKSKTLLFKWSWWFHEKILHIIHINQNQKVGVKNKNHCNYQLALSFAQVTFGMMSEVTSTAVSGHQMRQCILPDVQQMTAHIMCLQLLVILSYSLVIRPSWDIIQFFNIRAYGTPNVKAWQIFKNYLRINIFDKIIHRKTMMNVLSVHHVHYKMFYFSYKCHGLTKWRI